MLSMTHKPSLEILCALIENVQDPIVYLDRDFRFVYVPRIFAKLCHRSFDEIYGTNYFDLFPDREVRARFEAARDRGEPVTLRGRPWLFPEAPGVQVTYWDLMLSPQKDAGGQVSGLILSLREVTATALAEQRLAESEQRFLALAEELPQPGFLVDRTGQAKEAERALKEAEARASRRAAELQTILDVIPMPIWIAHDSECQTITSNPAAARFFKVTTDENISQAQGYKSPLRSVRYLMDHREIEPSQLPLQRAVREGIHIESMNVEIELADGTRKQVRGAAAPFIGESGQVIGGVACCMDITPLREAAQALEEADRRKTEFLAILSHELRNPLAPIRQSLYVLERTSADSEPAQRAKAVIDRQVRQLSRLVDDLLDVTRITSGKVFLQRMHVDLWTIVLRTVEDHKESFLLADIELIAPRPAHEVPIYADETRISQVIGNLLTNALKFVPKDGAVTVNCDADIECGEAVLCIRDTGIGIDQDSLPHLFKPFMQAQTGLNRPSSGLGLGLALVRGFVELHGGRVTARSDGLGRGAEFELRLPLHKPPATSKDLPAEEKKWHSVRRVLVIDDNVDAAETLAEALRLRGHEVEVAYNGRTGLAMARQRRPDVLLCDIGLPEMDGYAIARAFQNEPQLRSVLLIAVSGYAQPADRVRSRSAGFAHHLAKPPNLETIQELIASFPSP